MRLNPKEYDSETAAWALKVAECAYLNADKGAEVAEGWGVQYRHFDVNGSQGCVLTNTNCVILAYAGTDPTSLRDLWSDVDLRLTRGPTRIGRVHEGFSKYVQRSWRAVQQLIIELMPGRKHLLIIGHSLGAGAAAIASMRLLNYPIRGVYLFGCPCVGDRNFCREYDRQLPRTYSHTNNNDFARWIPFFGWLIGRYHHVARQNWFYFDRRFKRHKNPAIPWVIWDKYRSVSGLFNFIGDSIGDHSIQQFKVATSLVATTKSCEVVV